MLFSPTNPMMVDFQSLEEEVSGFVQLIQPTKQSNDARRKVYEYFKGLVDQRCKELLILPTGSSCSRTYLPDGDLDLIVVSRNSQSEEVSQPQQQQLLSLGRLFSVLTEEISLKENGIVENNRFTIRNVEFVNARTKLLHCRVNNIGVDITFHQISGIVALYFIEKVNKIVGRANLFKRSLLLVKVSNFLSSRRISTDALVELVFERKCDLWGWAGYPWGEGGHAFVLCR